MERSVYIIKPEAMSHRAEISRLIETSGLRIVARKLANIQEEAVDILYPDLCQDLRDATLYYYGRGLSEIGVVEGVEAITRLVQLAGRSINPAQCDESSIRFRFGSSLPVKMGKALYYRNAFHRTKNATDATRELTIFDALPDFSEENRANAEPKT
jgi:nucleoside diphosphate kinase